MSIQRERNITLFLKCVLLFALILTLMSFVNHYIRDVYKLLCAVIVPWFVYLGIKHKLYRRFEFVLILLFCLSYMITIVINRSPHIVNEVAMVGYALLYFFMVYSDEKMERKRFLFELRVISRCVISAAAVLGAAGLVMFALNLDEAVKIGGTYYQFGMYENRLWGVDINPNMGGALYMIALAACLYIIHLRRKESKRNAGLIVLSIMFFILIVLCQSRAVWIMVAVFISGYIFFIMKKALSVFSICKSPRQILLRVCMVIVALLVLYGAVFAAKTAVSFVPDILGTAERTAVNHDDLARLDKKENDVNSLSTGRTKLWSVGIKAFKEKPVFGVGFRSIDDYMKKYLSKGAYNNSHMGNVHNAYLSALVSSGMVGFLLFMSLIGYILLHGVKKFFLEEGNTMGRVLLIFAVSIMVGQLVESWIVFALQFGGGVYWLVMGYILAACKRKDTF